MPVSFITKKYHFKQKSLLWPQFLFNDVFNCVKIFSDEIGISDLRMF